MVVGNQELIDELRPWYFAVTSPYDQVLTTSPQELFMFKKALFAFIKGFAAQNMVAKETDCYSFPT